MSSPIKNRISISQYEEADFVRIVCGQQNNYEIRFLYYFFISQVNQQVQLGRQEIVHLSPCF